MGKFDSDGRFNADAFVKSRGYEYCFEEDSIAIKYLNEIDARDYTTQKIYTDVLFNDGRYMELASFDNRKDLYRNIKEVLSNLHSISTPNSHYDKLQYQGYVNITNPYILDAKGKNGNRVSRNLTDELRTAYKNVTVSQKESIQSALDWQDCFRSMSS